MQCKLHILSLKPSRTTVIGLERDTPHARAEVPALHCQRQPGEPSFDAQPQPCAQQYGLGHSCPHICISDPLTSIASSWIPPSVVASIAGLVSLPGQPVPSLYNLGSAVKEANKDAQTSATEVASMSVVLQGLQTYITGRMRAIFSAFD